MIIKLIEIILIFTIPLLILRFRSTKVISLISTVGAAYLAGMIISIAASFVLPTRDTSVSEILAYVSISLAIPLLLFSNNIKNVLRLSKTTLLSFLLLIISVLTATFALFIVFTRKLEFGEIFSGMAVALYTGGTPNLNAVACVFNLDSNLILAANISDILFGGLFYVFLMFAAKPLLSGFLKNGSEAQLYIDDSANTEDIGISFSFRSKGVVRNLCLSALSLIVSAGAGILLWVLKGSVDGTLTNYVVPSLMIGTTVLGIALSFSTKVCSVKENNLMGKYFATVFSFAIASIINISKIAAISLRVFAVYAIITTAAFIIHVLLCKVFRIGADTMIITSTAGIFGPAFIPGISKAIKADYLLASGLIIGSLGYTIGTFLGIGYTYFLTLFI